MNESVAMLLLSGVLGAVTLFWAAVFVLLLNTIEWVWCKATDTCDE